MYRYAKDKCRALNALGKGKLSIGKSSCLGRCSLGPTVVVYPQAVWYRWQNQDDIDEIIHSHLLGGRVVKRLLMEDDSLNIKQLK